ncbi:MAG TPA: hypothetical protein VFG15_30155 [Amycolatopsis sp.]|nr:hypothetical protein [Amycolatopsis sp.]
MKRFIVSADPAAIAAAAKLAAEQGITVDHVADDETGLSHLDVETPGGDRAGFTGVRDLLATWVADVNSVPFPTFRGLTA